MAAAYVRPPMLSTCARHRRSPDLLRALVGAGFERGALRIFLCVWSQRASSPVPSSMPVVPSSCRRVELAHARVCVWCVVSRSTGGFEFAAVCTMSVLRHPARVCCSSCAYLVEQHGQHRITYVHTHPQRW